MNPGSVVTFTFNSLELRIAVSHLRSRRDTLKADLEVLRLRTVQHPDVVIGGAMLALDTEIALLEGVVKKMWEEITLADNVQHDKK